MTYKLNASPDKMLTKEKTGINTTKKTMKQVAPEATFGDSFLEKNLKIGRKMPVATIPKIMVAKKGAINFPTRNNAVPNKTRKKKSTDFLEICCSKITPFQTPLLRRRGILYQQKKPQKAPVKNRSFLQKNNKKGVPVSAADEP
jgi:hypothetical protein